MPTISKKKSRVNRGAPVVMGIFTKPKVKYERIIEQGGEYVL